MITYSLAVRSDGQDLSLSAFPAVKDPAFVKLVSLLSFFRIHCSGKRNDLDLSASSWCSCFYRKMILTLSLLPIHYSTHLSDVEQHEWCLASRRALPQ